MNLTEEHKPHLLFDGFMHRAICTCSWSGPWRVRKDVAGMDWGEHGIKTIQRNINRKQFSIIGNPFAKGSEN